MSERPNVLQLCLTLDTGGLERVVVSLANELLSTGAVHPLICTVGKTTGSLISEGIAPGVEWAELKGPPRFSFRTALKLAQLVRREKIQLIHAHGTQPLIYALSASALSGVPIVFTKHNSYEDLNFFARHSVFNYLACRRVTRFIGVSEQATEILKRVFRPVAQRCETHINGVALFSDAVREHAQKSRLAGEARGELTMATVCRLAPEKDLVTLLEAFALVRKDHGAAKLWIIGDGSERGSLMQTAEKLDLKESVKFWGFRGKVEQILSGADVYVNSSLTEGISISILEGMSMAMPIVATAVGGTPSLIKQGVNGFLVEPRNPEQLAGALLRLAEDRKMCRDFGEQSCLEVEANWSLRSMAEKYCEIYVEAIPPGARIWQPADTRIESA